MSFDKKNKEYCYQWQEVRRFFLFLQRFFSSYTFGVGRDYLLDNYVKYKFDVINLVR